MELICAGAHGDVEESASSLPELGGVIAGLDGEFFDGVHAGLHFRLL